MREAGPPAKRDRGLLRLAERGKGAPDVDARLRRHRLGRPGRVRQLRLASEPSGARPAAREGLAVADAEQPGPEAGFASKAPKLLPGDDESLLGHVVRLFEAPADPAQERAQRTLMLAHEVGKARWAWRSHKP